MGSLTSCSIRLANAQAGVPNDIVQIRDQRHEILSLTGTVCATSGSHLHISLGDKAGHCVGGHLMGDAVVFTTAEIVMGFSPTIVFDREMDATTGYPELTVQTTTTHTTHRGSSSTHQGGVMHNAYTHHHHDTHNGALPPRVITTVLAWAVLQPTLRGLVHVAVQHGLPTWAGVATRCVGKTAPIWALAVATPTSLIAQGLWLSSVGDVLLEIDSNAVEQPPSLPNLPSDIFFLLGLVSFLSAHVCYIIDFAHRPGGTTATVLGAAAFALAGVLVAFLWDGVADDLRVPVAVYATVIAGMAYTAVGAYSGAAVVESGPRRDAAVGAAFFVVSDGLLAIGKFKGVPGWGMVWTYLIMMTYYIAQYKIARSGGAE